MGLLNKLTGGRAGTQTPARADGPGSAGNEVDGNGNARRLIETRKPIKTGTPAKNPAPATPVRDSPKEAGIPPLKQPTLPPGRSAILILCSKDRRPYWHVFKRSPSTELGWEFERHLPAVPKKPGERSSSTDIPPNPRSRQVQKGMD